MLEERVTGRRIDPVTGNSYHTKFRPCTDPDVSARLIHRPDDTAEALKKRLLAFHGNMASILLHYNDQLVSIQGEAKPDEVWARVDACLGVHTGD